MEPISKIYFFPVFLPAGCSRSGFGSAASNNCGCAFASGWLAWTRVPALTKTSPSLVAAMKFSRATRSFLAATRGLLDQEPQLLHRRSPGLGHPCSLIPRPGANDALNRLDRLQLVLARDGPRATARLPKGINELPHMVDEELLLACNLGSKREAVGQPTLRLKPQPRHVERREVLNGCVETDNGSSMFFRPSLVRFLPTDAKDAPGTYYRCNEGSKDARRTGDKGIDPVSKNDQERLKENSIVTTPSSSAHSGSS
jgi:hypothetical protein